MTLAYAFLMKWTNETLFSTNEGNRPKISEVEFEIFANDLLNEFTENVIESVIKCGMPAVIRHIFEEINFWKISKEVKRKYPTNNFVLNYAEQFDSPWFALLRINGKYCGGSLIKDQYIITAAHCFDDIKHKELSNNEVLKSFIKVRFGEWKTETDPDCEHDVDGQYCKEFVEISPGKLIVHEDYKTSRAINRYKNDIAIIKMDWPPKPSRVISSIDLPSSDDCRNINEDEIWTVTGFGHAPGTTIYSKIKKKIDMKIISHEECDERLGSTNIFYDANTHVCGKGTAGETTCQGDSAGFVKVACYANWINAKITELVEESDED